MRRKHFAIAALALALSAGSALTSFAGFVKTPQGVKYQWGPNNYCTGNWVRYQDHWYYFGDDQLLRTGWIQRDNTWYFAADTGELQAGIMKINGNVYYFDSGSCKLHEGYLTYDGVTYNFTDSGTTTEGPYVYTEWNSDGSIRRGTKFGPRY